MYIEIVLFLNEERMIQTKVKTTGYSGEIL